MSETATLELSGMATQSWLPDTRCYSTSDGRYLAVSVHPDSLSEGTIGIIDQALAALDPEIPTISSGRGNFEIVITPTTVIECNEEYIALTMTPVAVFDPGTPHDDALAAIGYQVA